ncbi:hypothetical protein TIFTF001_018707 [Ficus carica]|uniref:TF-B3 domain-containing protein n=1 Tax=Ficus carica TaxID=3494 RepID=A0AA88A4Y2_FICCA|nr:hypothetical protein TIFTF001_018707 [Ficus carica]
MEFLQKKLKKTDITEKLTVPSEWLGDILPYPPRNHDEVRFEVSLISLNDKSTIKSYPLVLSTRSLGYLKPVLQSRGWLAFVRETGLEIGDTIHIRKDGNGQIQVGIEYDFARRMTTY